jgi:hypothetical protein
VSDAPTPELEAQSHLQLANEWNVKDGLDGGAGEAAIDRDIAVDMANMHARIARAEEAVKQSGVLDRIKQFVGAKK